MIEVDQNTTHAPQDEDTSKRRQILDGAREVFMELGFDGASMGEIARAAGVSKGTLYVYFTDKTALFEAIVEEETRTAVLFSFDPDRDIATNLTGFGEAYIALVCRPGGGSAIRTVMAIAERMPELGSRFYTHVIAHTVDRFAAYLEARAALGELVMDDTQLAAWQFMQMCQATLFQAFIFQANPSPSPERIATVVDSATRVFFAAYRPKQAN